MADHKEYWSTESDQGSIRISEDVVASIAALAASETDGVSGLYSSVTRDIVSFLSKKNLSKGVRVELGEEDTVKVEISFLALFGHNICEVAKQVQDNVKSQIESMTGLHVVEINVHVGGVTFAPAAEEKAAEPEEKAAEPGKRRRPQKSLPGSRKKTRPSKSGKMCGERRSRRTFFYARYAGRGNAMGSTAQGKTAALCGNFALLCNYAVLPLRFSVK